MAERVLMTPARARALLSRADPDNRPLSLPRALDYAADMRRGTWREGARPIELAAGRLVNGQHRLVAVLLAERAVLMTVAQREEPVA